MLTNSSQHLGWASLLGLYGIAAVYGQAEIPPVLVSLYSVAVVGALTSTYSAAPWSSTILGSLSWPGS